MSILDKVVAAVTPPESAQQRRAARQKAWAAAGQDDWLAQILDHHERIRWRSLMSRSRLRRTARVSPMKPALPGAQKQAGRSRTLGRD